MKTPGLKLGLVGAERKNCANRHTANKGFAVSHVLLFSRQCIKKCFC